ncbi:MAG TPA: non-homologous end-joining DNA ligase [Devosia sp.]|nr:non-homologous end-joining DNA ligase [Devosia sp.]
MSRPATDKLKTYRGKRDFSKTAEPAGKGAPKRATGRLRFVVQKHDARRLHYDFRLELDGVLMSWAVTRGPSANPDDKRLAVRVEDHPLDYAGFEGTIAKGEYGGGTVMLWDEGTWEPIGDPHQGIEKGELKFVLRGKRMKGEWVLVHMKGRDARKRDGTVRENWLLIKHRDAYAAQGDRLTETFTTSVETGRDLGGIAGGKTPRRKAASIGESRTSPFADMPRHIARRARGVDPELVGEIESTEFTPDGFLRHPSFQGRREDKTGRTVTHEMPAAAPAAAKRAARPKARSRTLAQVELTDEMGLAAAERAGIKLTHPEKVVYEPDITKAKLAAYYAAVGERMLPHIAGRPLSLVRLPTGSARPFFQKHDSGGFPDAFRKVKIAETTGPTDIYLYIETLAGLIGGVQMSTQEFHIWGSHIDSLEKADRIIFDIDPDEGLDFAATRQAARDLRDRLGEMGLVTYAMLTGGKGIHVIAPLRASLEWPAVKAFCRGFAEKLAADEPDRFTSNIRKANRKGRMFVDYLRNERGSTAVCPYSTRAKPRAPCAVPVGWDELDEFEHAHAFGIGAAAARAQAADPWPGYFNERQSITQKMLKAVGAD